MSERLQRSELESAFLENRAHLEHVARRIVRSREASEDVLQDAFMKLLNLTDLGRVQRPLAYCIQVVRNVAIDHCRRQTLEATYRVSTDETDVIEPQLNGVATPERLLSDRRALAAMSTDELDLMGRWPGAGLEQLRRRLIEKDDWTLEYARVVEIAPGDYAATLYCYASAPNGSGVGRG